MAIESASRANQSRVSAHFDPIYLCVLTVDNIHCSSCVSFVRDILQSLANIERVDISVIDHTIQVQYTGSLDYAEYIATELTNSAFEVRHLQIIEQVTGRLIRSIDKKHEMDGTPRTFPRWRLFMSASQRAHIDHCEVCRNDFDAQKLDFQRMTTALQRRRWWKQRSRRQQDSATGNEELDNGAVDITSGVQNVATPASATQSAKLQQGTFEAILSIQGMTCASCASSITQAVQGLEGVQDCTVNLIANTASIKYTGLEAKYHAYIATIDDVGFDAGLISVHAAPSHPSANILLKGILSIEGMTCGSCTGAISREIESLSFVQSVDVDLLTHSAKVIFRRPGDIDQLVKTVDDLGYECTIIGVEDQNLSQIAGSQNERIVEFVISGMYCPRCPPKFAEALQRSFSNKVVVLQLPTLNHPKLTAAYKPEAPVLSIRTLIRTLNSIDPDCHVSLQQAVSVEQRSLDVQRRERNRIARHLMLTFIASIPTFIIGVVYMSLVPEDDKTKRWLQQPVWAGSATRTEWALFMITTPAYFYGGALFHERALREIWSLWRPQSKVPIHRRFFRFGSMNLLISLGTSVAYFSSLAVLIMDATSSSTPAGTNNRVQKVQQSETYFDTATFLIFFLLIGKFLESYSKAKTGDAVSMLRDLRPPHAMLFNSNETSKEGPLTKQISVDMLEIGDVVNVLHGACPPTDGLIEQEGVFLFDESSLTGESKPAKKVAGDIVFSGSTNISDPVRVRVSSLGGQTMLDQIVNVVREGQTKRAPIERLADVLTGYFTPLITLIAIVTWLTWLGLGVGGRLPASWLDVNKGGWAFWSLEFAIAVFVVACPCGLGLAAPTALFVGSGLAAKNGILVQGGGEAFQEASNLNAIVFDKTGTITEGKMVVTDVEYLNTYDDNVHEDSPVTQEQALLSIASALEDNSTHPIATAIAEYCANQRAETSNVVIKVLEIKEASGKGMKGSFRVSTGTEEVIYDALLGNQTLLESENASSGRSSGRAKWADGSSNPAWVSTTSLLRMQSSGCSTAILAIRRRIEGDDPAPEYAPAAIFAVTDPIRSNAAQILSSLRNRGIDVYMCTGDNATTARAIASQLEIPVSHIRAGALPQDKAKYIQELQSITADNGLPGTRAQTTTSWIWPKPHQQQQPRKIVAFVGDGTNDAPALAVADVSIAISHPSSSDIALTSASFILLSANLSSILNLVTLSRRVFRRVKFNFFWAGIYNICLIPVAAGVFFPVGADWDPNGGHPGFRLSPVWAAAAMAGSSLSVVLSSLALRLPELNISTVMNLFRKTGI